jgi:hypothetical protein
MVFATIRLLPQSRKNLSDIQKKARPTKLLLNWVVHVYDDSLQQC